MVKYAVICAAGMGSRLGLDIPKCMVDIGNKKLIDHLLDNLKEVENIRIVVGFKEQEVIRYVKNIRPDVVFVRNPSYNTTTNAYSLYLGSYDIGEPFINVDGDMILDPVSFKEFLKVCETAEEDIIGITKASTEDAVFVKIDDSGMVNQFSREPISKFEWCGIAFLKNIRMSIGGKYVYQEIEPHLPLRSAYVSCFEIDTPIDLDYANSNIDFLNL